jgi:hypothetical protein
MGAKSEIDQCGKVSTGTQKYAATHTTVTAIWPAKGNVLFSSKTDASISTLAAFYKYFCMIAKLHNQSTCLF